ncbi:MAG: phosphoglycerate dehydrogenase [Anaerolineaceae bacterium]|nr:MAG: phosphoglycerate dehydrogenase [Anaerolineaceae bacterium]
MLRILVSDKLGQAGLEMLAKAADAEYDMKTGLSKEELVGIMPSYDGLIVRSGTQVDADVLATGTKLKVVGRAGIGVDNIDVAAATKQNIVVMNTPGSNSVATAEQTMALMLAVSRHTVPAHNSLVAGEWSRAQFAGVELNDKVLGIVGFGRIGRLVAERAKAFGMTVLAHDPYVKAEDAARVGVSLVDLDRVFSQADYLTLHTAVTPETTTMINYPSIKKMKKGVIIINVARGKLIDEAALAEALQEGHVKAAALDVYVSEPPAADNPLIGLPHVLHTPHLGASTVEAQRNVATQIVSQVLDCLRGLETRNAVNKLS